MPEVTLAHLEECLEEVRVCEGQGEEGEECAEAALQHCGPDVLNSLEGLLVSVT